MYKHFVRGRCQLEEILTVFGAMLVRVTHPQFSTGHKGIEHNISTAHSKSVVESSPLLIVWREHGGGIGSQTSQLGNFDVTHVCHIWPQHDNYR